MPTAKILPCTPNTASHMAVHLVSELGVTGFPGGSVSELNTTIYILALIRSTRIKKIALMLLGIINIKLVLHDGE